MKSKIGFFLGIIIFFLMLSLPPHEKMYLPAIHAVLDHCRPDVKQKFFTGTSLAGRHQISREELKKLLTDAEGIRVHVPRDFHCSGKEGFALADAESRNGKNLRRVIDAQVKGLKYSLALALLMAVWWITEALPIPIVALMPMALLPMLGIAHVKYARMPSYFAGFSPYSHYLVVLFIGGFTIAEAMKKWHLHERIALHFINIIGFSPKRLLLGMMAATALISMFVSNTATAAMMMPIALAILLEAGCNPLKSKFGTALMLGIAYAASIGGIGTLIGTPPNLILAGFADTLLGIDITFQSWLLIGMPLVIVLLPFTWWLLLKLNPPEIDKLVGSRNVIQKKIKDLGPLRGGELNTMVIFILTALLWIFRGGINVGPFAIPGWTKILGMEWVNDSVIAIVAVILFYLVPVNFKRWEFTLDWETNLRIPWGTLLLFGGGIALGETLSGTGAGEYIALSLTALKIAPFFLLLFFLCLLTDFLTEITSNTATTCMMMPVLCALGTAINRDPLTLMTAAAVASSLAFMLPVATPPNAIVYGTGYVKMASMAKNGFCLNIFSAIIWTFILYLVVSALSPLINI